MTKKQSCSKNDKENARSLKSDNLRQQVFRLKVFVADPTQTAPLHAGVGLVQVRDPVRVMPAPHVALQADHPAQDAHPPLTGPQVVRLNVFVADPGHVAPLHDAAGLVQARDPVRVTPAPQVALQADHPAQDVHPPLTAAE